MHRPGLDMVGMTGLVYLFTQRFGLVLSGLLILALALAAPVAAADITISPGAGAIQAGVNSAADGDTIVLSFGTYNEHDITITGKSLTFRADTANGHGPADTIIDGQSAGRIFHVADGSSLTIDNLTLRNGRAANGANGAAGGPNGGGGTGGTGGPGGAIFGSTVTVTSSTITGCSAGTGGRGGDGGDGSVTTYGGPGGKGGAGGNGGAISATSVTITASTITGCSAGNGGVGGNGGYGVPAGYAGSGGSGGSGGAIYATTVTVTTSTITGCSAGSGGAGNYSGIMGQDSSGWNIVIWSSDGAGGSGSAIYTSTGTVNFNRLLNNPVGTPVVAAGGSINAENNWWGTNGNPSGYVSGTVDYNPWLILVTAATPLSITTAQTSVIQASLTYNSAGNDISGSGHVPDGIPVTFTATGGTVPPSSSITSNGIAATTFTPSGAGTATITTAVDGIIGLIAVTVTSGSGTGAATSIAIDPDTASTVYAGVDGQGIYRTTNGGTLWLPATTQPANKNIRALVIRPAAPATLFAGTYGGGVYTSADSGDHWTACANTNLANLNVLSLVSNSTGGLYAGTENGVYTSSDCNTWTAINGGLP
jgi:hypothetical protein